MDYNVYLATVMTIHAVALAILPFSRRLGTLITITCMHGLFGGFQDTATNLRMIIMHGQEVSARWVQCSSKRYTTLVHTSQQNVPFLLTFTLAKRPVITDNVRRQPPLKGVLLNLDVIVTVQSIGP